MSKLTTFVARGNVIESAHEAKCVVQDFNYKITRQMSGFFN